MSGGGRRELARGDRSPLHPLDGRREAPDRQRVTIRSPDGAALLRPRHREAELPRRDSRSTTAAHEALSDRVDSCAVNSSAMLCIRLST